MPHMINTMQSTETHPLATAPERHPTLDPERLAATAEAAARALLREGESANTRTAYASAMRYWCAWYAARYGQALTLPVAVAVVIQFIVDHAARKADDRSDPDSASRSRYGPMTGLKTGLVSELPSEVDQALVAGGHKARLGAPALNTPLPRIPGLAHAHPF